jgi:lipopolysaccharide transport system ATP-binding protein
MQPAIRAENVWKHFVLGAQYDKNSSMKEALTNTIGYPVRSFYRIARGLPPPPRTQRETIWALRDISLEIQPGEIVGIIGRNGAGKSTLFKVLSRITAPTRGKIEMHGRVASLLEVGTGFHPYLTGRENIFLSGSIFGMKISEVKRQFDAIVAYSEIERFLDTPVKHYSSGMYVRLAFAVAAHLNPDILLVDEILAVGDLAFQKKCLGTLKEGVRENRTVLFVSHSMQVIRQLCTRVIHIENGSIRMDAPTEQGITDYNKFLQKPRDLTAEGKLNRIHRSTGAVQVQTFTARNNDDKECWRFKHGENVGFDLNYKVEREVPNLALHLTVRSVMSGDIITTSMEVLSEGPVAQGTSAKAELKFPKIALRPGDYSLSLQMTNLTRERIYDVIDENVGLPWLSIDTAAGDPIATEGYVSLSSTVKVRSA